MPESTCGLSGICCIFVALINLYDSNILHTMRKNKYMLGLKKYLIVEFYYSILRRDWRISTFFTDLLLKMVAIIVVSVDRFTQNASAISASALTFYSTLAFIPIVALILAVARGFGASKSLETWMQGHAFTNPDVMQWVMNVAGKALDHTQSNIITGLGIVLLIWSAVRMMASTELAMNRIWGVKKGRGVVKKFTDYMSILFIAPILIVLVSSINVFMTASLQEYATSESLLGYAGAALTAILRLAPYVLVWFLFVFLYMFMPTTPVKFKYALLSGVVAGTIFQVVQLFYLRFQLGVSSYNAIYGGLAALPLLLVWLQLSWSIVLWGTELCYIMRNRHFLYRGTLDANGRWVDDVHTSIKMLRFISDEYTHNNGGPSLALICKRLRISSSKARVVLQELVDQRILVEVKDEDDVSYFPALDFHKLSLADLINGLSHMEDNRGEDWKERYVEAIRREFSGDTFA